MKKWLSGILLALAATWGIVAMQQTQQITLQWDPAPAGEAWTAIRIYDISAVETLIGTATCTAPGTCPNTLTLTLQKKAYSFTARSYNGTWESANSNIVSVLGPPSAPTGLKK